MHAQLTKVELESVIILLLLNCIFMLCEGGVRGDIPTST